MIKFEHVTKAYKGEYVALRDADVEVSKGEFVFLVGPSGSGKSTFMRLINRSETPEEGQIFVAGTALANLPGYKVPYLRRNIASFRTSNSCPIRPLLTTWRSPSKRLAGLGMW